MTFHIPLGQITDHYLCATDFTVRQDEVVIRATTMGCVALLICAIACALPLAQPLAPLGPLISGGGRGYPPGFMGSIGSRYCHRSPAPCPAWRGDGAPAATHLPPHPMPAGMASPFPRSHQSAVQAHYRVGEP